MIETILSDTHGTKCRIYNDGTVRLWKWGNELTLKPEQYNKLFLLLAAKGHINVSMARHGRGHLRL